MSKKLKLIPLYHFWTPLSNRYFYFLGFDLELFILMFTTLLFFKFLRRLRFDSNVCGLLLFLINVLDLRRKFEIPFVAINYKDKQWKDQVYINNQLLLLCSELALNASLNSALTFTKFPSSSTWEMDLFSLASAMMVFVASKFMVLIT